MLSSLSSIPDSLGFSLMQSVGSLTEPGPYPFQTHSRIDRGQVFRFQNNELFSSVK